MSGNKMPGLGGRADLTLTGACPQDFLWALSQESIPFWGLHQIDELTILLTISLKSLPRARALAKKTMGTLEVRRVYGILPTLRAMGLRAFGLAGLMAMLLTIGWLQSHIILVTVEGNQTIPTQEILWALEEEGVAFGTQKSQIHLESLKNRMLRRLPRLGWLTVNQAGSTARVIVRERQERPALSQNAAPANVVAKKAGLVEEVQVTGGTGMAAPGDVVMPGELLISGVTALDRATLLSRGAGEIYARTWNLVQAVLPDNGLEKVYTGRLQVQWALTLGKKTINFYKTSGISYGEYDKITVSRSLTLPGGYVFPLTLRKTVLREYTSGASHPGEASLLEAAADRQLLREMTAGEILTRRAVTQKAPGGIWLRGSYECREEIGVPVEIEGW